MEAVLSHGLRSMDIVASPVEAGLPHCCIVDDPEMTAANDLHSTSDLHLVVERLGDGYQVRGHSSEGAHARGRLGWPLPAEQQATLKHDLALVASGRQPRQARAAARRLGDQLFQLLFPPDLLARLRSDLDRLHRGGGHLRLDLCIHEAPELARLPWELLYDRQHDRFFATLERTTLVRNLELPRRLEVLAVEAPLTMVVVTAQPLGRGSIDGEEEWRRIHEALGAADGGRGVRLERLAEPTLSALEERLRAGPCHILHFIGHGQAGHEGGALLFANREGGERWVSGQQLSSLLYDLSQCRLVTLSCCHGAAPSDLPFHSVAESLLRQGIPAVVAMRSWLTDEAALLFSQTFYQRLAGGLPVDRAIASARRSLDREELGCQWATPVLYLRAADGELFELAEEDRQGEDAASPLPAAAHGDAGGLQPLPVKAVGDGSGATGGGGAPPGGDGGGPSRPLPAAGRRPGSRAALWLSLVAAILLTFGYFALPALLPRHDRCPPPPGVGLELVYIPAGEYIMESRGEDEEPILRRVEIGEPFCIGKYEVTNELWLQVMGEEGLEEGYPLPDYPAGGITPAEARLFVELLNEGLGEAVFSLPTEEQWEYAARAGTQTAYGFGDDPGQLHLYGNCMSSPPNDDGHDKAAPVGSFRPNRWGLFDMHGNVWEWTLARPAADDDDGTPSEAAGGETRELVRRGGSWENVPDKCSSGWRSRSNPETNYQVNGLRVVREVSPGVPAGGER